MDDSNILQRIDALVREERGILDHEGADGPAPEHRDRLTDIQGTLDQCWDLLRQRRAAREYGRDPDTVQVAGQGHRREVSAVAGRRRTAISAARA